MTLYRVIYEHQLESTGFPGWRLAGGGGYSSVLEGSRNVSRLTTSQAAREPWGDTLTYEVASHPQGKDE